MSPTSLPLSSIAVFCAAVLTACGGDESPAQRAPVTTAETATPVSTSENSSLPKAPQRSAEPGEGVLEVGDETYTFQVSECKFQLSGTFDLTGSDPRGEFKMSQFFLDGKWFQTTATIDIPGPTEIFAMRFASTKGAEPAAVDGSEVSWTVIFNELDTSADTEKRLGEGRLVVTCP